MIRKQKITVVFKEEPKVDPDTGRFGESKEIAKVIIGNIQAGTGKDNRKMPEGQRLEDIYTLFCYERLEEEDIVLWKGDRFIIESYEYWDMSAPLRHYRYRLQREYVR